MSERATNNANAKRSFGDGVRRQAPTTSSSSMKIISLSRLKSYMNRSVGPNASSMVHKNNFIPVASREPKSLDASDVSARLHAAECMPSTIQTRDRRQAADHGPTSESEEQSTTVATLLQLKKSNHTAPLGSTHSSVDHQSRAVEGDRAATATAQQESERRDNTRSISSPASPIKEAESSSPREPVARKSNEQLLQHESPPVKQAKRKRERIDNLTALNRELASRGKQDIPAKNNMTPDSLLLIQDNDHIVKYQQRFDKREAELQQDESNGYNIVEQASRGSDVRSSDTSCDDGVHISDSSNTVSDCRLGSRQESIAAIANRLDSSSTATSAHAQISFNRFKVTSSSNTSGIVADSNQSDPLLNVQNEPSNYSNDQARAPQTDNVNSNDTDHSTYHIDFTNFDSKSSNRLSTLANYSVSAQRLSDHYNQNNFPLSGQQIRLDLPEKIETIHPSINTASIFERGYAVPRAMNSFDPVANSRSGHQLSKQTSSQTYHSSNQNLMPILSSKVPPRATHTTMQILDANHNTHHQLLGLSDSAIADTHLDHLSNQYLNTNNSAGVNHHQHIASNHHYSYDQSNAGTGIHGHGALMSSERSYAHSQTTHQQAQQSIYHQLANNAAAAGNNVSHGYGSMTNNGHYGQMQVANGIQSEDLMTEAHQNQLNTAAAACAAVAVVSQTLKTVANQHNQHQHHYGGSIPAGFGHTTGNFMNMTSQHQTQFSNSSIGHLGHPHHQPMQNHHSQSHAHFHNQHQNSVVTSQASIVTRKYQCKMCPQVFMSKAEMKYHNQSHLREAKPYKCLQCPKAFANSSYLSQHMRIHQGVKPYTCEVCSRKFTQLSHLQQHKRTHTGDKPYKCNYMNCTKQFSQLSNLQSHSRCHQLDKPYKCNSCYKCFNDEQSLLEHIPRHLESKHLKKNLCIFCGSSYQQERGLVKHFQQYHTEKSPTLVAAAIAAGTTGNTSLIASLVSSTQTGVFAAPSTGSMSSSNGSTSSVNSSNHTNTSMSTSNSQGNSVSSYGCSANSNATHGVSSYQVGAGFL